MPAVRGEAVKARAGTWAGQLAPHLNSCAVTVQIHIFGGALAAREKNGAPWVPPWWQSFVIVPLAVIAMYVVFPVNKDSDTRLPSTDDSFWSSFSLDHLLIPVIWTLGVYYILILPIFYLRRYRWNKKHG